MTDTIVQNDTPAVPHRRTFGELLTSDLRALPVVVGLVALWIFFTFQSDVFLSARNISNLLLQSTVVGIMALGIMFVLLVKEIDLSVAAINGITAVLMAKFIVESGFSPWIAIPVSIMVGVLIGVASARWVTFVGVPSFVVTLGLGLGLNGIQLLLLPQTARYGLMNTGVEKIAQTKIAGGSAWLVFAVFLILGAALLLSSAQRRRQQVLEIRAMSSVVLPLAGGALFGGVVVTVMNAHQGIPLPTLMFAVLLMIGGYVLKETTFGLSLYAVGNNEEAARRAGIKVAAVKMAAFGIAGGICRPCRDNRGVSDAGRWRVFRRGCRRWNTAPGDHRSSGYRRRESVRWAWCDLFGFAGCIGDRYRPERPESDGCGKRNPPDSYRLPACHGCIH